MTAAAAKPGARASRRSAKRRSRGMPKSQLTAESCRSSTTLPSKRCTERPAWRA
jgi:hypothetical protein